MIGVDIIDVSRFQYMVEGRHGQRFLIRVFTPIELRQCEGKNSKITLLSLAGYFAVKEAVIKASQGELSLADLHHIEISHKKKGKLDVHILDINVRCRNYEVSLSQEEKYAIAVALKADF